MPSPLSGSVMTEFSPSGTASIDALLQGTRWGPATLSGALTISYSFPTTSSSSYWSTDYYSGYDVTSSSGEPWNGFAALTASQCTQVRAILSMISSYTNLVFVELSETSLSVGELRYAYSSSVSTYAAAHAYTPFDSDSDGFANENSGDVWVNADMYSDFLPDKGSYDYLTLIHETGHALGLKHTFETDDYIGMGTFGVLDTAHDCYKYSVMSYNAVAGNQNSYVDYNPTTLMSYDVYALQYLYGKNLSHNSGNTVYTYVDGQQYNETIWDSGGSDTIVYSSSSGACSINLNAGQWQDLGASLTYHYYTGGQWYSTQDAQTVQILAGVVIENATGGSGSDRLTGNSVANTLLGNDGNDTLSGGAGNDTLNGGNGSDSMTGGAGSDIYYVNSTADKVIEADASSTGGVDCVYSYLANYVLGANVENGRLVLSTAASLTGNALNNLIYAGAGNNVLSGGTGTDTVSYAYASAAIKANLALVTTQATLGSGSDTFSSIENLYGSNYNDTLSGSSGANLLYGAAGNDVLSGASGNDTLRGGAGNDKLTGGAGVDIFRFDVALDAATNKDTVVDFSLADDVIQLENAVFSKLLTTGALSASMFRTGAGVKTAADSNDFIIYDRTTGALYYDADGSATGSSAIQFAIIGTSTHAALTSADFVVT